MDRRESAEAEEASDSPPPREESREEERLSREPARAEARLPRPSWGAGLFELRLLRRLELDCCFSHCCRSGAESGMLTRAWADGTFSGREVARACEEGQRRDVVYTVSNVYSVSLVLRTAVGNRFFETDQHNELLFLTCGKGDAVQLFALLSAAFCDC